MGVKSGFIIMQHLKFKNTARISHDDSI
jgi:hypothetical protein